jgi:hypothetical protein
MPKPDDTRKPSTGVRSSALRTLSPSPLKKSSRPSEVVKP